MVIILGLGKGGLFHDTTSCGNMVNSRKKKREISRKRAEALLLLPCKKCFGPKPSPPPANSFAAPRPGRLQRRIASYMEANPFGGTYWEIAAAMGYERNPVQPKPPRAVVCALKALEQRGLVERDVQQTENGQQAYVWIQSRPSLEGVHS